MMKLIHLTDLHLVPAPRLVYGLDPRERLRLAVADINSKHADAAAVVISGDLADRGELGAYTTLRELLQELRLPVYLGIGNHDDRTTFLKVFSDYPVDAGGVCQMAWTIDGRQFLMLDSVGGAGDGGVLSEDRLAWLDARLCERPGQPAYVFLHHNPVPCGLAFEDSIMLQDAVGLAEVLNRHDQVRFMAFGHVHRAYFGVWYGVAYASLPGLNHQTALDFQAAERGSPGSHEPPAYGVMLIDDRGDVVYHLHHFLDNNPKYFYSSALNEAPSYEDFLARVEHQRTDPAYR